MTYTHLDFRQRCQINGFLSAGFNQTQIAKRLGVNKSTISRELSRNQTKFRTKYGYTQYKPNHAQSYAEERQKNKKRFHKFNDAVESFVRDKLIEDWSPEQISGYASKHCLFWISHERIYQFILKDKKEGGELYKHLRHQNKKYRKRYGSPKRESRIKNKTSIEERPSIVDEKKRIGDWEVDCIIGKNHKQAVVSIVDRMSKFTILKKVPSKKATLVSDAIIEGLKPLMDSVLTITSDNGTEFSFHEKISNSLNAKYYFCHPYSSWERGVNENINGLVRQYLKKGSSFNGISDSHLTSVMKKLNSRPRKTLSYLTPEQMFTKQRV